MLPSHSINGYPIEHQVHDLAYLKRSSTWVEVMRDIVKESIHDIVVRRHDACWVTELTSEEETLVSTPYAPPHTIMDFWWTCVIP